MKYPKISLSLFVFCLFWATIQSCSEDSHLEIENSMQQVKGSDTTLVEYFSAVPSYAPSVTLNDASIGYDFRDKEVQLVSTALDVRFLELGKHWQKHKSVLLEREHSKLNVYTYDNGTELLILDYGAKGERKSEYFYSSNISSTKDSGASGIIRLTCKGSCSNEVQSCSGIANVSTGNVTCSCPSDDCYMEFSTLD